LSAAQQEALAKAREKARQTKLARTEAKKKEQEEFKAWKDKPVKQEEPESDQEMSASPSPPPKKKAAVKKRAFKKPAVKRQRQSSSESEDFEDDSPPRRTAEDHLRTVKAAYDVNMARYKNDVMYRSLFPYL